MLKKRKNKKFNPLEFVPQNIKSRLAISEGILCISEEIKKEKIVFELLNNLKNEKIISKYKVYTSSEFTEKFKYVTLNFIETSTEIQTFAKQLFQKCMEQSGSDIHIKDMGTHGLIRFRLEGILIDYQTIEATRCRDLIQAIYNTMCDNAETQYSYKERQDARIISDNFLPKGMHSIRVHTEPTEKKYGIEGIGTCMYLRLLYDAIKVEGNLEQRLSKLGFLPAQIESFHYLSTRTGLFCFSGPTGHGKSTALKHGIECTEQEKPNKNYMSVEDPPEFHMQRVDQIAVQTKNTQNRGEEYISAIAGTMRSDLDFLLIGEIRFAEAIRAAINTALSGNTVWATFHASDAISIILRMATILEEVGAKNPLESICEVNILSGLEYQRLIPQLCPHCSEKLTDVIDTFDKKMLAKVERALNGEISNVRVKHEGGCEHCNYLGIKGQQVAAEIIVTDTTFLNLMKKRKVSEAREYWLKDLKGITHVQHALKYLREGKTDPFICEDRLGLPLDYEVKHDTI